MTIATDYPLLNVIWTMLVFFGCVIWIWTLFIVLMDVFARHDISGWGKAGWTLVVIVMPLLGVLIYLIAQGHDAISQEEFDEIKERALGTDGASRLTPAGS